MSAGDLARVLGHPAVARVAAALGARAPHVARGAGEVRHAAVALILTLDPAGDLELLMIKRATFEGDPWSGHIALPGGRQEPFDASLAETAVREAREETAVDLARAGRLLGRLDDVEPRTPRLPPLVIAPFVFALDATAPLAPSAEVAEAFWVPVAALQDPAAEREIVLELTGGPLRVRSFQHAGHTIWGLTERILRQLLALLAS